MHKSHKSIYFLLCICLFFSSSLTSYAVETNSETKEECENVITISSPDDFLTFSENCRLDSFSKDLTVYLDNDIDLTGIDFEGIPIFYGTFDGKRHRIKGLTITDDGSFKGLFRYIEESATVKNLIIEGNITPGGSRSMIGGLAGSNAGTIKNCAFSGTVTGADSVGGLIGVNKVSGLIENCQVYGTIYGDHFVGGVAGENFGIIRNCSNLSKINTTAYENSVEFSNVTLDSITSSESAVTTTDIGGITGSNKGILRSCENHGNIGYQHIGYNIGGIAGSQSGYITDCSNYSNVLGRKEIGGIVGQMEPATTVNYDADTLQILEGQINRLSVLTDRAVTNTQNNTNISDEDLDTLSGELDIARSALDVLSSPGIMADPDRMIAAQSTLAGSLSNILATSDKIAHENQETSDVLNNDMQEITKQAGKISSTIGHASDNVGGSIQDVSDLDTDSDTAGKVNNCTNFGSIEADLNVGGIAGAITLENDLDPEEDITISGNQSLNFECEIRAVIKNCKNQGDIKVKRQYAGGIVGRLSIGLIHTCTNTGAIDATSADYAGGIAGESLGYVRHCNAKCPISAKTYVGGISGLASTVSDCRSMVQINDATEKIGAILGYQTEDFSYENNYYLPVDTDLGGIDGISFEKYAKPLSKDDFFALDNLPDMFKKQTLRFVYEGGSTKTITIDYGERIHVSDIPSVPKKDGYKGSWEGYYELISSQIVFDTSFSTVYTPLVTTVESRDRRENGAPILLAQGEFTNENKMTLYDLAQTPSLSQGKHLIEAFEYSVLNSNTAITLRYLPTKEYDMENISMMVLDKNDTWRTVNSKIDGSYIVFPISSDDIGFASIYTEPDYSLYIIVGICSVGIIILVSTIGFLSKKRKKNLAVTDTNS